MKRRDFLQMTGWGVGASFFASPALAHFFERHTHINDRRAYTHASINIFSAEQNRLIGWVSETILPADDYPGAIEAGVHKFIALIFRDWMREDERQQFLAGLAEIDEKAQQRFALPFVACSSNQRTDILVQMEKEQDYESELGGSGSFSHDAPFMPRLKELVVTGFFMSQTGGERVLRHNIHAGYYEADIPLGKDESAWDDIPFM